MVLRTAAGLRARGVDVRVLTTGDRGIREYEGVRTERLPVSRYAFNLQVRRIATAAREAEIIHTFTYNACMPSYVAARWIGRPIICEVLALFGRVWRKMRGPFAGQAIQAWERFLISRPYERTLFPSERCRVAGLALGARAERSLVVPPGIDHNRFEPAERKSRYVLFAGHFDHRKGLQHVIAAARALPDIPFRAVGWSDDPLDLNTSVPPNLHITEARGGPPYWDALRGAPIFFFPSHAETFGIGLAEAMACGLPVVAVASGAVPELVTAEVGELVPRSRPDEFAQAINALFERDQEALRRAARAKATGHLSWDAAFRGLLGHYAHLKQRPLLEPAKPVVFDG